MELNLSKEDAVFRDELRTFVAENYPTEMRVPNPETDLTKEQSLLWHRILYKKGWIAPSWPGHDDENIHSHQQGVQSTIASG